MLGTPGCIGAGLDCSYVDLVCRVGLPTSIIHFIQEMGRCRRCINNANDNVFTIIFHLNDYVYLIERMYIIETEGNDTTTINNNKNDLMTKQEERKYYTNNLNKLLRLMLCEYGCWHANLEILSSNPYTSFSQSQFIPPCGHNCPHCDHTRSQFIKRVNKSGLQSFLASTLMSSHEKNYSPTRLVKALLDYPLVGRVIYGRNSSIKVEKASNAAITILQLLCCDILYLHVEEAKNPKSICVLSRTDHQPHYLLDKYWEHINHF